MGTLLSPLEQQCVREWPRSVLSIAQTTEGYTEKSLEDQLKLCIESLRAEFGESKEDKCRLLAGELSAMKQEHSDTRNWRNLAKKSARTVPHSSFSNLFPN